MKTITIKQPWASLICTPRKDNPQLGIKDIENRTWPTKFRGRVLVHAGAAKARFNFTSLQYEELNRLNLRRWYDSEQIKGAIIGSVEIVDCVINHPSIWAERHNVPFKPYNWVLANPVLFPEPVPAKGKLSFWDFDIESEFLGIYSDGKSYSHLEVNSEDYPENEECVMCGSTEVTITEDADICHDCGYVCK